MECRLKKSLYGLKQATRAWKQRLPEVLETAGFEQSKADTCLYRKRVGGKWCYVLVHVDDLIVVSEDERTIKALEQALSRNFRITSLGNVKFCLGIQVDRDGNGDFLISQQKYIEDVVRFASLQDAKPSTVPIDTAPKQLGVPKGGWAVVVHRSQQ